MNCPSVLEFLEYELYFVTRRKIFLKFVILMSILDTKY